MKFTQYLFYSKTRTKLVAFRLGWFGFDKGKRKKIWYHDIIFLPHTGPKSSMSSNAGDVIRTHVDFRETEERGKKAKSQTLY